MNYLCNGVRLLVLIMYFTCVSSFSTSLRRDTRRHIHRCVLRMMPEGPEVRSLVESLQQCLTPSSSFSLSGVKIVSGRYEVSEPGGWDILQEALVAADKPKLEKIGCKGKFIYFKFTDPELSIWSTLGLTGGWSTKVRQHTRLSLSFESFETNDDSSSSCRSSVILHYYDMRNFGTFKIVRDPIELEKKLDSLGFDW